MGRYTHLTIGEREEIMVLRRQGLGVRAIARALGRSPSTVSRELARNSCKRFYWASTAQARYEARRASCVRPRRLADPRLAGLVQRLILEGWSPEWVSGRLRLEAGVVVGTATIYRAIRARELDPPELAGTRRGLAGRLRRKGRRRRRRGEVERRGKIRVPASIAERPAEAGARSRLGDWEADTVAGRAGGPCLVTLVDRRSRYLVGGLAPSKTSAEVARTMSRALEGHPALTVTPDRGSEFALWAPVAAATGAGFYYALPRHPWQRGTNENTNGLIREYLPKGCDLSGVTDAEVQEVYHRLNTRPRKCLGYRTPWEVHHSEVLQLI